MILDDRKNEFIETADTTKISRERVNHIIREYIGMRKLCAKCVPLANSQFIVSQINGKIEKFYELRFELLTHLPYSPFLDTSDIFLFSGSKRLLTEKKSTRMKLILKCRINYATK